MNPESILKGRMAESLVEELLKRSGNTVTRFGYESIVQNLMQLENSGEVEERLRAIPDFIVLDKKGKPEFVEVKFRFDPDAMLHDETIEVLERVEKYWNPLMVFVNCMEKPYFRVCRPPYFKNFSLPKKGLVFEPLAEAKEWHIDPSVYAEYEALVEKYLTPTLKSQSA
jgi:hypothetical protein